MTDDDQGMAVEIPTASSPAVQVNADLIQLFHADGRSVYVPSGQAGTMAGDGFLPYPADPKVLLEDFQVLTGTASKALANLIASAEKNGNLDPSENADLHVAQKAVTQLREASQRVLEATHRRWPMKDTGETVTLKAEDGSLHVVDAAQADSYREKGWTDEH
jgi:hypothetical protein